jgi:hypothetical protein
MYHRILFRLQQLGQGRVELLVGCHRMRGMAAAGLALQQPNIPATGAATAIIHAVAPLLKLEPAVAERLGIVVKGATVANIAAQVLPALVEVAAAAQVEELALYTMAAAVVALGIVELEHQEAEVPPGVAVEAVVAA